MSARAAREQEQSSARASKEREQHTREAIKAVRLVASEARADLQALDLQNRKGALSIEGFPGIGLAEDSVDARQLTPP